MSEFEFCIQPYDPLNPRPATVELVADVGGLRGLNVNTIMLDELQAQPALLNVVMSDLERHATRTGRMTYQRAWMLPDNHDDRVDVVQPSMDAFHRELATIHRERLRELAGQILGGWPPAPREDDDDE